MTVQPLSQVHVGKCISSPLESGGVFNFCQAAYIPLICKKETILTSISNSSSSSINKVDEKPNSMIRKSPGYDSV